MHSDPGVELRVGRGHHRRHGAASGESGDIHPGGIDLVVGHNPAGDSGDDGRLPRACLLVGAGEPVPIAAPVGRGRLLRVGNEEGVLLGEGVHPGASGEVGGILLAAVQHDEQGYRRPDVAGGDIEVIASGPGWVGVVQVANLSAGCGPRSRAGGGRVASEAQGRPRGFLVSVVRSLSSSPPAPAVVRRPAGRMWWPSGASPGISGLVLTDPAGGAAPSVRRRTANASLTCPARVSLIACDIPAARWPSIGALRVVVMLTSTGRPGRFGGRAVARAALTARAVRKAPRPPPKGDRRQPEDV